MSPTGTNLSNEPLALASASYAYAVTLRGHADRQSLSGSWS